MCFVFCFVRMFAIVAKYFMSLPKMMFRFNLLHKLGSGFNFCFDLMSLILLGNVKCMHLWMPACRGTHVQPPSMRVPLRFSLPKFAGVN